MQKHATEPATITPRIAPQTIPIRANDDSDVKLVESDIALVVVFLVVVVVCVRVRGQSPVRGLRLGMPSQPHAAAVWFFVCVCGVLFGSLVFLSLSRVY
jgi:hypothetical protein